MMRISLESARVNAKMTMAEVAKKVDKSEKTISNWERGVSAIPAQYYFYLCKIYGMDPDYIDVPVVKDGFFYDETTE